MNCPQFNPNSEDEIDVVDGLFFADEKEKAYILLRQKILQA